jgi:hypothetical protein
MKITAVQFYAENAMKLEIERLHGKISTEQMLNKLSNLLIESQKMFRKTVHSILGIPYGLKEKNE